GNRRLEVDVRVRGGDVSGDTQWVGVTRHDDGVRAHECQVLDHLDQCVRRPPGAAEIRARVEQYGDLQLGCRVHQRGEPGVVHLETLDQRVDLQSLQPHFLDCVTQFVCRIEPWDARGLGEGDHGGEADDAVRVLLDVAGDICI